MIRSRQTRYEEPLTPPTGDFMSVREYMDLDLKGKVQTGVVGLGVNSILTHTVI